MVNLTTSDDVEFKVDREVVERSVLIKNMLEGSFLLFVAIGRRLMFYTYSPRFYSRRRRIGAGHPSAQRFFQRDEKGARFFVSINVRQV
jgi:hypothetical protein